MFDPLQLNLYEWNLTQTQVVPIDESGVLSRLP